MERRFNHLLFWESGYLPRASRLFLSPRPKRFRLKRAVAFLQVGFGSFFGAHFVERIAHVPPETVKINLAISTMGLQMMGLRDALQMDETLSIPAHMMLREEFRRPLDEVRAKEGTKAYLQKRDGPFQPEPFGPRSKKKA